MKILHISTWDISGGAARAAYRLHEAFCAAGLQSEMLVQEKKSDDYRVFGPVGKVRKIFSLLRPIVDRVPLRKYPSKTKTLFSPAWVPSSALLRRVNESGADVVHLHWVAYGMLRIEDIAKIQKPIVWTVHDMWPFTGGCHYDEECEGYADQCGKCPVLGSDREKDISRSVFTRKKKSYSHFSDKKSENKNVIPFHYVCTSEWLYRVASRSNLFKSLEGSLIPYALDCSVFKPIDKSLAREILGLEGHAKIILFGAIGGTMDHRKGWKYLESALLKIAERKENISCVVFGASKPEEMPNFGLPIFYQGHLSDNWSLALLYSAADVMVVPSIQEAFGQTASEAQACGCPVVAFRETGVASVVQHQVTGYLAELGSEVGLERGIVWCLEEQERSGQLSAMARSEAVRRYSYREVTNRYVEIFANLIKKSENNSSINSTNQSPD